MTLFEKKIDALKAQEKRALTVMETADFLNVSRLFVVNEIEAGRIPSRMVGSDRKVPLDDLAQYAAEMCAARGLALAALSQLSGRLGGY